MNIKLLRHGVSTRTTNPGASPAPTPIPQLGPEWWTADWDNAVGPLDARVEVLLERLRRNYKRVRNFSDPLGTVFSDFLLEEELPIPLWQAILRVPDQFARGGIVLRKLKVDDGFEVRVCDPEGQTIGMVEPDQLFALDWWLERCAYWLLAHLRTTPERIRELLERELPTR
jgi:hypothetical protein